jgi:hypothetical protein
VKGPLRFRINMGDPYHIRVHVYDTVKDLHRATKELHGETCHPKEQANTIVYQDAPGGCIAAILLTWRHAPPYILAHEAVHAGVACVVKLGPGLGPDEDEPLAGYVEKIFRAINQRVHA